MQTEVETVETERTEQSPQTVNPNNEQTKTRYHGLDFIRGIALISMVLYHALWDVVHLFGVQLTWYDSPFGYVWQQSICYTFILLSGFCVTFGKHKLRRGLIVTGASVIVSVVTIIAMPNAVIKFGVLSLIGVCMLLALPFDKIGRKINPYLGLAVCLVLFFLTRNVSRGNLGFESLKIVDLPNEWYANDFTAFFGFPHKRFRSSDYFPLFPWSFLFFSGYFLRGVLEKHRLTRFLTPSVCKPIQFIGRHTLPVYMAHQPVVYGILYLVFLFIP